MSHFYAQSRRYCWARPSLLRRGFQTRCGTKVVVLGQSRQQTNKKHKDKIKRFSATRKGKKKCFLGGWCDKCRSCLTLVFQPLVGKHVGPANFCAVRRWLKALRKRKEKEGSNHFRLGIAYPDADGKDVTAGPYLTRPFLFSVFVWRELLTVCPSAAAQFRLGAGIIQRCLSVVEFMRRPGSARSSAFCWMNGCLTFLNGLLIISICSALNFKRKRKEEVNEFYFASLWWCWGEFSRSGERGQKSRVSSFSCSDAR